MKEKQISTWQDFRKSITGLENLPGQKYEDVEESRATILADYRQIIDEIDCQMNKYFSSACRPATKCVVERVPQFKEATSPAAYYFPAALDGKTPGTFFANLRSVKEVVKFKMGSLAYHEAVPGHHFQVIINDILRVTTKSLLLVKCCSVLEAFAVLSPHDSFHCLYGRLGTVHRTISGRERLP